MRYRAALTFLVVTAALVTKPIIVADLPVASPPSEEQIQELIRKLRGPKEVDWDGPYICPIAGRCGPAGTPGIGTWDLVPAWSKPR